jgi:hypothetical protein
MDTLRKDLLIPQGLVLPPFYVGIEPVIEIILVAA